MQTLLRFLARYRSGLLFIALLSLGLYLVFGYNTYQKARAGYAMKQGKAAVEAKIRMLTDYIGLAATNEQLADENLKLRNELAIRYVPRRADSARTRDTIYGRLGEFYPARIINNSISKRHNFFTIEGGTRAGIAPQMPVLAHGAVAGIVIAVSPRYAEAISLLNTDLKISAVLPKSGDAGSVAWDGLSHTSALLHDIPHHVAPAPGDSVVTSGYSNIFPYGILIGFVDRIESRGGDFNTIRIRLAADFNRLRYVSVFKKAHREEIDSLANLPLVNE